MCFVGYHVLTRTNGQVVKNCPAKEVRQTLMFSATFPNAIQQLAREVCFDACVSTTVFLCVMLPSSSPCALRDWMAVKPLSFACVSWNSVMHRLLGLDSHQILCAIARCIMKSNGSQSPAGDVCAMQQCDVSLVRIEV